MIFRVNILRRLPRPAKNAGLAMTAVNEGYMQSIWRQRIFLVLFFSLITSLVMLPLLLNNNLPPIIDVLNHLIGIMQAKSALTTGQLPLRVANTAHLSEWPYPYFQFYSPTSYMIAGALYKYLNLNNPYTAYKICLALGSLVGGIYIYRLAYWLTRSREAALLTGAAYLLAPYCIVLIYYMGAFNEMLAVGILPAVIFYTLKHYYRGEMKTFLLGSLMWYLLLTIHLITFLSTSFFVGFGLLLMTLLITKNLKMLGRALAIYVFGCLLAMWHLAPIVALSKSFMINQSFSFMSLYKILFSHLVSPVLTISAPATPGIVTDSLLEIKPSIGIPFLLSAALSIYLLVQEKLRPILLILFILFFTAFLLIWMPISLWHWPLTVIQYSWRLLSQIMWIGALLFALSVNWLFSNALNKKQVCFILLFIVGTSAIWASFFDVKYKTLGNTSQLKHFSSDGYLLDAKKNHSLIGGIENITLYYQKNKKGEPPIISLPNTLLQSASNPSILIKGNVFDIRKNKNAHFVAIFNEKPIAYYPIKKGKLSWSFPLNQSLNTHSSLLQIAVAPKENKKDVTFQINRTSLNGFFDSKKVVALSQSINYCRHIQDETVCELNVSNGINLLELPMFYYPNMLSITLNGKQVPYTGILYNEALITAIVPEAKKENIIRMKFVGLLWANFVSSLAFGLFLLLGLYLVLDRVFYSPRRLIPITPRPHINQ